ncbi:hypothetical protein F2Q69_00030313 [Brassica cretica]|uniref:Uncharacterized protein n=1 Tax=Brassica cretica TaxID=69181 RepID=A0A8S9RZG8_BRACR|nr:hypothetical protein F2Q69_00030313 [Brassica cretica]
MSSIVRSLKGRGQGRGVAVGVAVGVTVGVTVRWESRGRGRSCGGDCGGSRGGGIRLPAYISSCNSWPINLSSGACPAVPEATRKFNGYSHQILQVWNVRKRSSSIDNNTSSLLDSRHPLSTQTPVSSTDTCSPPSTEDTLPSTNIFHPTSIDTSVRTSIDTEPRDMVATLILVRDEKGDLHDKEGHLRNAAGHRIDA